MRQMIVGILSTYPIKMSLHNTCGTPTENRKSFGVGNRLAHGADPVRDADLYLQGQRTDLNTFKALYGLDPLSVRRLSGSSQYPVGS